MNEQKQRIKGQRSSQSEDGRALPKPTQRFRPVVFVIRI